MADFASKNALVIKPKDANVAAATTSHAVADTRIESGVSTGETNAIAASLKRSVLSARADTGRLRAALALAAVLSCHLLLLLLLRGTATATWGARHQMHVDTMAVNLVL